MGIEELKELRAGYEKELILAEARLSVINDIIAKAESKEMFAEQEVVETAEYTATSY